MSAGGDHHGIPWSELIVPQAVNFAIFFGLFIYLVKKPIRDHFAGKNEEFEIQKKQAEEMRVSAEKQNFEVRNLLRQLEETSAQSLEDAQKEAAATKQKLLKDAHSTADKLSQEAEKMAHFEHMRAVSALREEFVMNSTSLAKENLKQMTDEKAQGKLNNEFVGKLQAVSR